MTTRRLLGLGVLAGLFFLLAGAVGPWLGQAFGWIWHRSPPEWEPPQERDATDPPDVDDWTTLVDLAGAWDFRLGDRPAWEGDGWDRQRLPGAWEDQGYAGYDGAAWYRTTFALDAKTADAVRAEPPFLLLGRIDDADEVWLNGTRVGQSGRMPPRYRTAAFDFRTYRVPPGLLTEGENVLAVRVYDDGLAGGILEGPLALAVPTARNPAGVPVVANLDGDWRFAPGDGDWAAPDLDDRTWATVRMPGVWEDQGFPDLGGYAWLRKDVELSAEAAGQNLVLLLGAVDDLDETFVNGVRVGSTGAIDTGDVQGDEWQRERVYPVPAGTLRAGRNVVAVRVYDGLVDGGIHRGPIALMTPEAFAERERRLGRDER